MKDETVEKGSQPGLEAAAGMKSVLRWQDFVELSEIDELGQKDADDYHEE